MLGTRTFREGGVMMRWLWATGTRVGASVHAIALFVLNMVVSLGFCTLIHLHYICGLIVRIIVCLYMWL